jgi:putative heme iron utilization protein
MAEDANAKPNPAEQVARLYEQAEAHGAAASEELVGSSGFAALLGRMAENVAALTKLSGDSMDLVLRNLRLAGRRDVVSLARQLARTEDKLERVLQEVEALRDELSSRAAGTQNERRAARAPARRSKQS